MEKTARAIIVDDGKVLVFFRRRIRNDVEVIYYSLPGGHLEDGETYEDAVIREVKEDRDDRDE